MNDDIAIKVECVSKIFHEQMGARSFKEAFVSIGHKIIGKREKVKHKGDFTALKDINFEIKKGEFFGVVGRNGCGKSTLLKIIAGVYTPTTGNIIVNGRLTPFIELGVGFNPELSGRDNVFLNGALLGFTHKQMQAMYKNIVDFAELHDFMGVKLKNYSSGMQVRLAFSVAIRAESEILLIDEVLAVGDALFQQKCFNYFRQLKKEKKTVVFVSHDLGSLREYCDKAILIEDSKVVSQGKIDLVINEYMDILNEHERASKDLLGINSISRWGTGKATVLDVDLTNQNNEKKNLFTDVDNSINIQVTYIANENIDSPVFGITIKNATGTNVFDSNTLWHMDKTKYLTKGQKQTVVWTLPNLLNTGQYNISPAVADSFGHEIYDWIDSIKTFKVRKKLTSTSILNINHQIKFLDVNG